MIYFIRHGYSHLNQAATRLKYKYGHEEYINAQYYLITKFHPQYYDVYLTNIGITQAYTASQYMANIDIDLIIVSPLRRALHTADIIFRNHKSHALIIVEPAFREIMYSSDDVGTELTQSMHMYPHFDFSRVKDPEAWYIHTLRDEHIKQYLLGKLSSLHGAERHQAAATLTVYFMKKCWYARRADLEHEDIHKYLILPSYTNQKEILLELCKQYKTIAVVAHSYCIKKYAGRKIKNCEIFPYSCSKLYA